MSGFERKTKPSVRANENISGLSFKKKLKPHIYLDDNVVNSQQTNINKNGYHRGSKTTEEDFFKDKDFFKDEIICEYEHSNSSKKNYERKNNKSELCGLLKVLLVLVFIVSIFPIDTSTGYYYVMRYVVSISSLIILVKEFAISTSRSKLVYIAFMIVFSPVSYLYISCGKLGWVIFDILSVIAVFVVWDDVDLNKKEA